MIPMGEGLERYVMWPMDNSMPTTEKNVPDVILAGIYKQMCDMGREGLLFYDGTVSSAEDWMAFIKAPGNIPVVVVDTETRQAVLIVWLNQFKAGSAMYHGCATTDDIPTAKLCRGVLDYWRSFKYDDDEPFFHVLYGITPDNETHLPALGLLKKMGFTVAGTIPKLCNLKYESKRVGGILSYIDMEA